MRLTQCLLVFVLVCELAIAQHMDVSEHKHQINGAEHPEQIPDSDAYRMFFLAAGTNPDAIVSSVGLTNSDKQSLEEVIQIFTDEYVILSDKYNQDVTDGTYDTSAFGRQLDGLVHAIRVTLSKAVSKEGMKQLDHHIQKEKRRMVITPKEVQP